MQIKTLPDSERNLALDLVWRVFLEFEAPDYSDEGVLTFRKFLDDENAVNSLEILGAYEEEKLLGVIATRGEGGHIALFFVDAEYQRRGIGRKLFQAVLDRSRKNTITVNSSPYAADIYCKLGFSKTGEEQEVQGMRFIPMEYLNTQP